METPPRRLRATDATPAAVGMTGLAWLMGAEQRTLGKDPGQLAANALETPNGTPWTPRMELVTSPGSDGAFSNAVSPSPAGFGPSSVAATRGNGPTGSVPESPTLEAKKSLGPVRTDSASSVDSLGSIGNAATVTPRQVSSIMDQSKKVIGHLRRLAQEEQNFDLMEPNGTLPTYENLVSRLMDKFRFQKEVNSVRSLDRHASCKANS